MISFRWTKTMTLAVVMCFLCTAAHAQIDTLTVRIKGMRCEECAHKVKNVVKKGPGIESIYFNIERRTATIAFDKSLTSADSIEAHLAATGRYAASPYSPSDIILRGYGQRIAEMKEQADYDCIYDKLHAMAGIDSLAPHLDKQYIFLRYDANRTCRADVRKVLVGLGFTPVNYYSGNKVAYAYYQIPVEMATQETVDDVLTADGVEDVNVNVERRSLAVTYFTDETTAEKLKKDIEDLLKLSLY